MPEEVKNCFIQRNEKRIHPNGDFVIVSQKYRTQEENRASCMHRLQRLLDDVCNSLNGVIPATDKAIAKIKRNKAKNKARSKKKSMDDANEHDMDQEA